MSSHFEDDNNDENINNQKFNDNVNKSLFVDEFSEMGFINPITGSPIINQGAIENDVSDVNNFMPSIIDDGEFLDTTADVLPNNLKHATCGKLSVK